MNLLKYCIAMAFAICSGVTSAGPNPSFSDYIFTPHVSQGQKLWIDFSFDPSSYSASLAAEMELANTLILNMGGTGHAKGTTTSLYLGGQNLGTASYLGYGSGPASGMFYSDSLGFSAGYFWSKSVGASSLHSILAGTQHGLLEVTPIGGGMEWSGWGPHAAVLTGPYAIQDIFPIATIHSMLVVDVNLAVAAPIPEPETYALMLAGLGLLGVMRRRKQQDAAGQICHGTIPSPSALNWLRNPRVIKPVFLIAAMIFFNGVANAQSRYSITPIGTLEGYGTPYATAINNNGDIVGWANSYDYAKNAAFVYRDGTLVNIGGLGGSYTQAHDINDSGQVVGFSQTNSGNYSAFLYSNAEPIKSIGVLSGSNSSYAYGINNSGQIIGTSVTRSTNSTTETPFLYANNEMSSLGQILGLNSASGSAINDVGQIVGGAYNIEMNSFGRPAAFLWDDSIASQIIFPGGRNGNSATAINNVSQVAGWLSSSWGGPQAFLYSNGSVTNIGSLLGDLNIQSYAVGLNNHGEVVGYYFDGSLMFGANAFLYQNGTAYDLNNLVDPLLGWRISTASDINDKGQIAAFGCSMTGCGAVRLDPISYTAIPIPEPETYAMMLAGLGLLGVVARRRKHKQ